MRVVEVPDTGPGGRAGRRALRGGDDGALTVQARDGSDAAFAELYRRHVSAARSTARYLLRGSHDADDVVADAFAGVLSALRRGGGPRDANFRSYLLSCVRNGCILRGRQRGRSMPVDPSEFADRPGVSEDQERFAEADVITAAYSSLPAPWQRVLWLTDVEDRPLDEVAGDLHLRKPAAAALSYRAREALAEAYLAQSILVRRPDGDGCSQVAAQLARYVRKRCRPAVRRTISDHLAVCEPCSVLAAELGDVNHRLRGLMIPPFALGAFLLDHSKAHGAAPTTPAAAGVAGTAVTGIASGTGPAAGATTTSRVAGAFWSRWVVPAKVAAVLTVGVLTFAPELNNAPAAADSEMSTGATAGEVTGDVTTNAAAPVPIVAGAGGGSPVTTPGPPPETYPTGRPGGPQIVAPVTAPVGALTTGSGSVAAPVPDTVPTVAVPGVGVTVPPTPVVTVTSEVAAGAAPAPNADRTGLDVTVAVAAATPTVPTPTAPVPTVPVQTAAAAVPASTAPAPTVPATTVAPTTARRSGIDLAAATGFAVLANTAITSTGATSIRGDVGVSGGPLTGIVPAQLITGTLVSTAVATGAQGAVTGASAVVAALVATPLPGVELGGRTLGPGTYSSGTLAITGTLTLDGGGAPDALFVFKASTTLVTASASKVVFVNGAQPCNVFWNVGSSATLGTFSTIGGSVIAEVSVTATTGVTVNGRLIARGGAVTLDTDTIHQPTCA